MSSTASKTIDAIAAIEGTPSLGELVGMQWEVTKLTFRFASEKLRPAGEWLHVRGQYLCFKCEQFLDENPKVVWGFWGLLLLAVVVFFATMRPAATHPPRFAHLFWASATFLWSVLLILWLWIVVRVIRDAVEGFRWLRHNAPRFFLAVRAARSAWEESADPEEPSVLLSLLPPDFESYTKDDRVAFFKWLQGTGATPAATVGATPFAATKWPATICKSLLPLMRPHGVPEGRTEVNPEGQVRGDVLAFTIQP